MADASWQPVVAALAHPESRVVLAHLILGHTLAEATDSLPEARRRKVTHTLTRAGLLVNEQFNEQIFRDVLAAHAATPRTGIDRFIEHEQITHLPSSHDDRIAVLAWVTDQIITPKETLTEPELNERLRRHHDDTALIRRYLVDYQFLTRTPHGTKYQRAG